MTTENDNTSGRGIDNWNQRLDRNLESENQGDQQADLNAEDFSNEQGSGDQSDEAMLGTNSVTPHESEDNMAKNHPHYNPEDDLDREE